MKKLLLLLAMTAPVFLTAQVVAVSIQAGGLTCSMCSNAINKSLKTLDFVSKVEADIKTYTFEITCKPGSEVSFDMLKNKVESAGFTICNCIATIRCNKLAIASSVPVTIQHQTLLFTGVNDQVLEGDIKVKLLDKGFVSAREYKMNKSPLYTPPAYHVTL